jgi:putative spermidine/putrescine transport system permease protein
MFKTKTKMLQLFVTLGACTFLLVPTILSVMAGLTVNYFKGISSGLTLKWVYQVGSFTQTVSFFLCGSLLPAYSAR